MLPLAAEVRRLHSRHWRADLDRFLPQGGALSGRLFARLLGNEFEAPLLSGARVGGWRIERMLGRGGSSTVYLAHRADGHFDQQAALKIVRQNPLLIEQFRRERQILADLRHPAIARLIDGGQLEDGRLWFAMEPVFGERVDDYVRNRRLPLPDRLKLFEDVCAAVAYAHRRCLIHRDIKPANLLVDETGWPCLLDFGIATTHGADEGDSRHAMTPIYASPEQRAGRVVTMASDVFQLGALLRALVAPDGEPCSTLPRRPRRAMARELAAVIAHATADDAAHRYAAVTELMADVAAIRLRRPPSVRRGVHHRVARFLERHALSSVIALAGAAALLCAGAMAERHGALDRTTVVEPRRDTLDSARAGRSP
jgi:serine/threonine protein kinase